MTQAERQQRISEIYRLAAQLRPAERRDFLERECQGDPELLQGVQSLFAALALSAPPPRRIGKYTVSDVVGTGGFGQVFRALDPTVGRQVAIKVLNSPGDPGLVQRFQAEAKTAANLHHKNIVTVHEFGEEGGMPYLVMEFLDGTTLHELIRRNSLSLLEKLEIMTEVAAGLQYAHERGVTHRDVKPANIMRLDDGSVKILDFGIARVTADLSMRLTERGILVGSMMYMAPEQFHGTSDALSDIFAYGITFYELLTGSNPFDAGSPAVTMMRIASLELPPVRSMVPECPVALDRLLAGTLTRNRALRCASMADVVADAQPILLELRRQRAAALFLEAQKLVQSGQWDAARSAIRRVLELDPLHAAARKARSEIEETLRRRDEASRPVALPPEPPRAAPNEPKKPRKLLWLLALSSLAMLAVAGGIFLAHRPAPVPVVVVPPPAKPVSQVVTSAPVVVVPLKVTPFSGTATVGQPFSLDADPPAGSPPETWEIVDGVLPPGLALYAQSGSISGTPTEAGSFHCEVRVSDSLGQTAVRAIEIEVAAAAPVPGTPVLAPTGPPPAAKPAVPACTARPFHLETYGDSRSGELIWTGKLAASDRLEIRNNVPSQGKVTGDQLPLDVPVRLTVLTGPSGGSVTVASRPSAQNCWVSHLTILNSGAQLVELQIRWEVYQP